MFETAPADNGRTPEVESLAVELGEAELAMKITGVDRTAGERPDVSEADVVVSGGRGMQDGENFKLLEELCQLAGRGYRSQPRGGGFRLAGPTATRWARPASLSAPTLYVACGISGAVQHLAGMVGAKVIVAINKDPEAPIFKVANYGLVGDVMDVLPVLNAALRDQS